MSAVSGLVIVPSRWSGFAVLWDVSWIDLATEGADGVGALVAVAANVSFFSTAVAFPELLAGGADGQLGPVIVHVNPRFAYGDFGDDAEVF